MPVCVKCHIEYENGEEFCGICGSPLLTKEKPISSSEGKNKTKEEKPNGELICPACKLIYEKMTTCIRCGAILVRQNPSQEKEEPERSRTLAAKEKMYEEELKAVHPPEVDKETLKKPYSPGVKKEPPQVQTPENRGIEKLPGDIRRSVSPPRKSRKDFLGLSFKGFGVLILIPVAIYLLWSTYFHFATKRSRPSTSTSQETFGQILHNTSVPKIDSSTVLNPEENQKEKPARSSTVSKEVAVTIPSPSIPITPKTPISETQDVEGIKGLLEKIRQANLQKNIELFMSCYTADFKDREGKKRTTLESWENFKYLELSYDLKKHSLSGNSANARVEWLMRISPKMGGRSEESKTFLDVTFKKEGGSWKIKEIKPVG
jgi:hypothetical protein